MITVVGIGADGAEALSLRALEALHAARVIVGSERQLALLPATEAELRLWPSPIGPLVDELVAGAGGVCVLASGDPMLFGIGATLARRVGPERLHVIPHPSAFALACARLGWAAQDTELSSTVGRPVDAIARLLQPGRRIVVYVAGRDGAAHVARLLRRRGFGPSRLVVLERLGAAEERLVDTTAADWDADADELHAVALELRAEDDARPLPLTPGLPDDAFDTDGQITRRHVRAITLAELGPLPGERLWDVGAGSGSIGIEWLRAEPRGHAIAIEARADRAARIGENATALGVPRLQVVTGAAPAVLDGLDAPDAVFVGGGVTEPGLLEACIAALGPGGRIVANAVTVEGEGVLLAARDRHGGALTRIGLEQASPVGRFTAWRAQLPIVQWVAVR